MRAATRLLLSCALLGGAVPAAAQSQATPPPVGPAQADEGGIQDVVVTAQRRAERSQDVPIAITALSGTELIQRGVTNTLLLGQFVPNLIAQNNTGLGSANAYYLRGLGSTETIPTFDPSVGTYLDDIYLSRQNANNLSLFDVERIEVLRGPQGTLFGRNTTGGAINVILRRPDFDSINGYAEAGYGAYNRRMARGSINLPVNDHWAFKLSGYWQQDDGYARNVTTGQRANDDDGFGVRFATRLDLGGARWNASAAYIEANGENLLNFRCNPLVPTQCNGRYLSTGIPVGGTLPVSPYAPVAIANRKAFYGLGNNTQTVIVASNFEIDIAPTTTLSLITGFVTQAQQYALDFADGRALPSLANPQPPVRGYARGGFDILNDGRSDQITQEVKLSGQAFDTRLTYVAGLFYIYERVTTDFADLFTLSPATTLLLADRILRNTTDSIAGYVQADYQLTRTIKLTAGVRYTDETKAFDITDSRAQCTTSGPLPATCLSSTNLFAPSGVAIPNRQNTSQATPRFVINYQPNRDLLFYASATRGFKSGGWNARSTAPSQLLPFGPEKVWSYEAGVKSELFDRRLRANVNLYWMDVDDLQTLSALANANGSITFLTRNFADYRNRGIEIDLQAQPVRDLNVYFTGGYQDAEYRLKKNAPASDIFGVQSVAAQQAACRAQLATGVVPASPATPACAAGIVTATGDIAKPVRTPEFTLALGATYRLRFGDSGLSLLPSVNASWHSDQEVQTSNLTFYGAPVTGTNGTFPANAIGGGPILQGSRSPAAWLVNAGVSLFGKKDQWQLVVECTNCFDEAFTQSALANTTYLNEPRRWMVRGRVNF
ncbi:MAG: TonB-dependent receptor [Sphingomonadaceae bacterium]|nr:TonB-dependent receptor [Sphingomonadaceae bacterium]